MDKKTKSSHVLPTRDLLQIQDTLKTERKKIEMRKGISYTWKGKLQYFIADKKDFKTKAVTRGKEGPRHPTSGHLSAEPKMLLGGDGFIPRLAAALFTAEDVGAAWGRGRRNGCRGVVPAGEPAGQYPATWREQRRHFWLRSPDSPRVYGGTRLGRRRQRALALSGRVDGPGGAVLSGVGPTDRRTR